MLSSVPVRLLLMLALLIVVTPKTLILQFAGPSCSVIGKPAFQPSAPLQSCRPPTGSQEKTSPPGRNGQHCTCRWRIPNVASACCTPIGKLDQRCRSPLGRGRGTCP